MGIITSRAPDMFETTVIRKVHGKYLWDHFHCRDSFVRNFVQKDLKWSFRRSTRAGKKTPENVQQILTDAFLRHAWTIAKYNVPAELDANSDQTLVNYTAGAEETYAAIGSKQVEVVGKDERRGFTLMVGISMSGEVLPFQAIYSGKSPASLPTSAAPGHSRATEELKFHFEYSKCDNHWSTIETMKSYVTNILAPYFDSHRARLGLPNQICIWQIDCWSVHRSSEFRGWMAKVYPWIRLHFIPANCTGLFQPCDVGIQRVLKLAMRQSALSNIVDHTMDQLSNGVLPSQITFEKWLPVVRDRSVGWLVNGYEAINNPEIVQKVVFLMQVHSWCVLMCLSSRLSSSAQLGRMGLISHMSL